MILVISIILINLYKLLLTIMFHYNEKGDFVKNENVKLLTIILITMFETK